jgi:cytochrome c553
MKRFDFWWPKCRLFDAKRFALCLTTLSATSCAGLIAALGLGSALAGDVVAGKVRASMCATCHGPLGISQLPNAPHLAGQPEIYLMEQLKQYRSGKRANEVMAVIAKPLTDTEIEDLAAWYSSIAFKVTEK